MAQTVLAVLVVRPRKAIAVGWINLLCLVLTGDAEVRIDIYFGNEKYACRKWEVVPRVGELISIDGPKAGRYKIVEVMWVGDKDQVAFLTLDKRPEA